MKLEKIISWEYHPLSQLLEFVTGGDWGKDITHNDPDFDLAYCIRGSEIKNWEEVKGRTASLRKVKISSIRNRQLKFGDILVEISGGGPEQPVGRTVLIDKTVLNFEPSIPKICTNFLRMIRPINSVEPKFLNLYLKLFYYSGEIVKYQGGSNNLRNLKFPDFVKIEIPLPPLPTQQKIVSKIEELFSELDKGKQQLETARDQLKIYRQAVLKWAFEGKLTAAWREKDLATLGLNDPDLASPDLTTFKKLSNLPDTRTALPIAAEPEAEYNVIPTGTPARSVDGEPILPEGWKWVKISDMASTYGGYAFKSGDFKTEGKYQVLRMGNVRPGALRYDESPVYLNEVDKATLSRSLLMPEDIIITQTGTRKKRDYGFTVIIPKTNLLLNQRIAAIRFNEEYIPKFFLYFSWTDTFKDQFFANETGNVGQGNVGMKAVTETLIPFCKKDEQQLIVQEIESRLSVCDKVEETINNSLQQAETLRQSILKKAFEGKLN
jgi:type I restriction enzyme, S subunit